MSMVYHERSPPRGFPGDVSTHVCCNHHVQHTSTELQIVNRFVVRSLCQLLWQHRRQILLLLCNRLRCLGQPVTRSTAVLQAVHLWRYVAHMPKQLSPRSCIDGNETGCCFQGHQGARSASAACRGWKEAGGSITGGTVLVEQARQQVHCTPPSCAVMHSSSIAPSTNAMMLPSAYGQ
jgi:hypothetical protein